MASRLPSLFQQHLNSSSALYAGGTLSFYASGTSTPLAVYSDAALSVSLGTSITLNSAGRPSTDVFLSNVSYKVVLADSSGNTIWTADPVSSSDFASFTITKVGSGNPNGSVAGTAGSAGVLPTLYWDYTSNTLYACTTTGTTTTAVWTAINPSASSVAVPPPQGYLTPTSGMPVITSSVQSTSVYYTPFVGNSVPIYNGATFAQTPFSELTLTLSAAGHAANTIYDVFAFLIPSTSTVQIGTGPAWSVSTAGAGARGTGAGTTEITRLNGLWVNAQSMTARNGSTTYSISGNYAIYLGSIYIDSSAGNVTNNVAYGTGRKWGIWNAYNRQPLYLKAGDPTANWSYNTATIRASNNGGGSSLTVFQGLAEEWYDLSFKQTITASLDAEALADAGIGWNSTTVMSGKIGHVGGGVSGAAANVKASSVAEFLQVPSLGINTVTSLENASATGSGMTWYGTENFMLLTARWRG